MLEPLVTAKFYIAEKIYYIIFLLFPAYYRKKVFKLSAKRPSNGTQNQIRIYTQLIVDNENRKWRQSFAWGTPALAKSDQYDVIKSMVTGLINESSVVLELGAYDGMWTQYWLGAKKSFV